MQDNQYTTGQYQPTATPTNTGAQPITSSNNSPANTKTSHKKMFIICGCAILLITAGIIGAILITENIHKEEVRAHIATLEQEIHDLAAEENEILFEEGISDEYYRVAEIRTNKKLEKQALEAQL